MPYEIHVMRSGRLLQRGLLALLFAPSVVAAISVSNASIAAVSGFFLGLLLSIKSPVYALPILMVGAALNNIGFFFGLHFGWILIGGCALGCIVYGLFHTDVILLDINIFSLIVVFSILEVAGYLVTGEGRIDRLVALLSVLFYMIFLVGSRPDQVLRSHFHSPAKRDFLLLIGSVGLIVFTVTLSMLSSEEFSLSRAGELGLAIGETESSPRSLSNILGLVTVICLSSVLSARVSAGDRLLLSIMGLTTFLGLFYTGSRMPAIATVFGLGLAVVFQFLFFGRRLRAATVFWVLVTIFFLILLGKAILTLGPGALPFVDGGGVEFRLVRAPTLESNIRLLMWEEHFSSIGVWSVVFGSGIGAMGNPHSLYVGTLGAFGIVGLFVVLWFIFSVFHKAFMARSTVACSAFSYVLLALSSSSDVDRSYFWVMASVVLVLILLDRHVESES